MTELDPERQKQAKEYARIRRRLWLVDTVFGAIYAFTWLFFGWTVSLRDWLMDNWSLFTNPWLLVPAFIFVFGGIYSIINRMPLGYYSGFILPHRFGQSRHIAEHDGNLKDWSWVAPGSERRLLQAIRRVLRATEEEAAAAPWKSNLPMGLVKKELYLKHPAPRVAPWVSLQYVGPNRELREVQGIERTFDVGEQIKARWSFDNGRAWSEFTPVQPSNKVSYEGVPVWEGEGGSVFDPRSNLLVQMWLRQIEVNRVYHNFTYVRTSSDQGRTWSELRQLRFFLYVMRPPSRDDGRHSMWLI